MRVHILLLAVVILGAATAAAAQQFPQSARAFDAYERKDYPGCARLFLEAIEAGSKDGSDHFGAAICFAHAGRKDEAFRYLDQAFDLYFNQTGVYEKSDALEPLRSDPRWQTFMARVRAREAKVDKALREELLRMREEDQAPRLRDPRLEDPANRKLVEELTAKHVARLRAIVKERGWPGRSVAGTDGANAAWLVVQHADLAVQREFLPLLQAAAKANEASAIDVAYLTDRVLVGEGKKQIYGSQGKFVEDGIVPEPIEDEAHVDERRKAVGLGPIADYYRELQEMYRKRPAKP
jgi:hypothetical protein